MALQGSNCPEHMDYRNIGPSAAWPLTEIDDAFYRKLDAHSLSPWLQMDGFNFGCVSYDWMHNIFLGTARDLVASGNLPQQKQDFCLNQLIPHMWSCFLWECENQFSSTDPNPKPRHLCFNFQREIRATNGRYGWDLMPSSEKHAQNLCKEWETSTVDTLSYLICLYRYFLIFFNIIFSECFQTLLMGSFTTPPSWRPASQIPLQAKDEIAIQAPPDRCKSSCWRRVRWDGNPVQG